MSYLSPVNDPWFQATKMSEQSIMNSDFGAANMRLYTSTDPVAVLGCTEETLLSNSSEGKVSTPLNLVTHIKVEQNTFELNWSQKQISIVQRILYTLSFTALSQAAYSLNGNGLLATSLTQANMSPGLPSNQWQLELTNWLTASLNALQTFTVQYVTGYGTQYSSSNNSVPPSDSEKWMCGQQIISRDDVTSFSVLGLAILVILSGSIITANTSIRRFAARCQRRRKRTDEGYTETLWSSFDILNLKVDHPLTQHTTLMNAVDVPLREKSGDAQSSEEQALRPDSSRDIDVTSEI